MLKSKMLERVYPIIISHASVAQCANSSTHRRGKLRLIQRDTEKTVKKHSYASFVLIKVDDEQDYTYSHFNTCLY